MNHTLIPCSELVQSVNLSSIPADSTLHARDSLKSSVFQEIRIIHMQRSKLY